MRLKNVCYIILLVHTGVIYRRLNLCFTHLNCLMLLLKSFGCFNSSVLWLWCRIKYKIRIKHNNSSTKGLFFTECLIQCRVIFAFQLCWLYTKKTNQLIDLAFTQYLDQNIVFSVKSTFFVVDKRIKKLESVLMLRV